MEERGPIKTPEERTQRLQTFLGQHGEAPDPEQELFEGFQRMFASVRRVTEVKQTPEGVKIKTTPPVSPGRAAKVADAAMQDLRQFLTKSFGPSLAELSAEQRRDFQCSIDEISLVRDPSVDPFDNHLHLATSSVDFWLGRWETDLKRARSPAGKKRVIRQTQKSIEEYQQIQDRLARGDREYCQEWRARGRPETWNTRPM